MLTPAITEDSSSDLLALILPGLDSEQSVQLERSDSLHKVIAFCRAQGAPINQIADTLKVDVEAVERLCKTQNFLDLVLEMQTSIGMTDEQRLEAAASIAIDQRVKLMHSNDLKVQDSVTRDFLDRHLGRPTQRVETVSMTFTGKLDSENIQKDLEQSRLRLAELKKQRQMLLQSSTDDIKV